MKKISIDLGSGVTKIYMTGCGVVLTEATCVAVEQVKDGEDKKLAIKAYGDKARALSGRAAVNTRIVNPVLGGDILYEGLCASLLSYFLEKIEITPKKARKTEAVFILPCGVTSTIKEKYLRIAEECGIGSVYFTLTPFAAVLGHNAALSESVPVFSVDIGYAVTNIAALSQDGIISGLTVNLGGRNIDAHIIDELAESSGLKIGSLTAEKLKNTVGSLLEDDNKMNVFEGTDVNSGAPASLAVNSDKIYPVITAYIDRILQYAAQVLNKLPAEVASGIMRGGIYLSGGVMQMDGLPQYIGEKLGIPVNMPEDSRLAAVIGGGAVLTDDELLEKIATID